jgi:predicted transcriptional regulator
MPRRARAAERPPHAALSRREREIMDVVYRLGEANAAEVAQRLPDRPGYHTIRVTMGILEKKGVLAHRTDGARYVYRPTLPLAQAKRTALDHTVRTFFRSSPRSAILALLDMSAETLTPAELDEIAAWIADARGEDR